MKFFEKNISGGCYYEFIQGEWDGETFWAADSLYLHDDVFCELKLYSELFKKVIPNVNNYGDIVVTRENWNLIVELAHNLDAGIYEFVQELNLWAKDNFQKNEVFTILGI